MNQTDHQAYPLSWPIQRPRIPSLKRCDARFTSRASTGAKTAKTMTQAIGMLYDELKRLKAGFIVVSTNIELRLDGQPRTDRRAPEDPGAAVYFKFRTRDHVLACDAWKRVEDNIYAIALHIQALRGQERWGVGTLEQAFAGYKLLPAFFAPPRPWQEVLNFEPGQCITTLQIKTRYRDLAAARHPDAPGGSHDAMTELNRARDEALAYAESLE